MVNLYIFTLIVLFYLPFWDVYFLLFLFRMMCNTCFTCCCIENMSHFGIDKVYLILFKHNHAVVTTVLYMLVHWLPSETTYKETFFFTLNTLLATYCKACPSHSHMYSWGFCFEYGLTPICSTNMYKQCGISCNLL